MSSKARVMMVAVVAVATAACAALGMRNFKEPVVTLNEARITGLGISGGSLEIVLSIYNPNSFRLDGSKLSYKVQVDSVPLGEGEYQTKFQVDKGDSSQVVLPFSFTYAGLGAAGRQLMQTGSVEYRVMGDVTVGTPIGTFTRPYDQRRRLNTMRR